jgi:HK97 family phage major capsid protein
MRPDEFKQLLEQRNALAVELRSFSEVMDENARKNEGAILAEDQTEYDRREEELIKLNDRVRIEKRTESATADPAAEFVAVQENGEVTLREYRTQQFSQNRPRVLQELEKPEVSRAVYSWLLRGKEGMDLEEYRVLSKAASGGGFFVPVDLADQVIRALRFLPGGVTSLAKTAVTSTGDTFNVPANLTHGTAAWIAESGSYTPSDETITNVALSAFKAGTKIIVSEELLTDSAFDLQSFITTEFGERIGALAESAYISGDGSGKPTGILDAASAVSISTLPAGYVTTLAWAGLATAIYSVPAPYRANMSLLVSDSLFVKLIATQDSTGAPLWAPSVADGAPDRFAGFPIYSHPNLAAVGANAKSMIVGDFNRGYWIRRVDGVFMQRQNELHSDSGQVGFRAYLRLDGKVALADALRVVAFAAT